MNFREVGMRLGVRTQNRAVSPAAISYPVKDPQEAGPSAQFFLAFDAPAIA